MAKVGTLVTYPNHYRGLKALIAGALSGADFDVRYVDDATISGADSRVPLLQIDAETSLFDANAICFRLADDSLRGRNVDEATDVLQWMQFADYELLPPVSSWVFPLIGVIKSDVKTVEKAKEESLKVLKALDDHLLFRTFMLGHRITLADITIFCNLVFVYKHVLSPSVRRPFPCLNRWFKTLQENPVFGQLIGAFQWCEVETRLQSEKNNEESAERNKSKEPSRSKDKQAGEQPSSSATLEPRAPRLRTKEELFAKLQSLSIEFVTVNHRHVLTIEELVPELGTLPIPGVVGKNLFLKDKKKKNKLYLLTAAHDRPINLKNITAALGSAGELRLADESVLLETLGVKQGCVTPFALINDAAGAVTFLMDSIFVPKDDGGVDDAPLAYFHPMTNDATSGINKVDLLRFLDEIGHPPQILEL